LLIDVIVVYPGGCVFFFSSRRRHTRFSRDWSSDVCSSDLKVNVRVIEFLIPLTIFITASSNIFRNENIYSGGKIQINYLFAGFFGLIHGLGFSSYLRSILGRSENIVTPLLAFNLGLELGQLIIVAIFMVIAFILVDLFGVNRRDWKMVISSAIAGIALILMKENRFWTD